MSERDRRTPRAYLGRDTAAPDPQTLPPVSPVLVEWLEREFPVKLSEFTTGLHGMANMAIDQARQTGQQEVLNRLRTLLQPDEG